MADVDRLVGLLKQCLVQITGHSVGSGFFVAPGVVLTCAHVAGNVGQRITVAWRDAVLRGTVVSSSGPPPGRGLWPYPDLALVALDEPAPPHMCVWLDGRRPSRRTEMIVAGYADELDKQLGQVTINLTHDGESGLGEGFLLKLSGEDLSPGMSGGPVLNTVTGGVCAVTKANRRKDSVVGGYAVPLRGLRLLDPEVYRSMWRDHDRHHDRAPRTWAALADIGADQSSHDVSRAEERRLRAILAAMPPGDDHVSAYQRAAGPLAPAPDDRLIDHGDVVTDLGELMPSADLPPVLAYATDLAGPAVGARRQSMLEWVLLTAGRLHKGDAVRERMARWETTQPPVSVMARLRPAGNNRGRYWLTVWRYVDAGHVLPVHHDLQAASLGDAWQRLKDMLPDQISTMGQHRAPIMVELFVPPELMDEPVHDWRPWPNRKWSVLGRKHAVVIRDLERMEGHGASLPSWESRWRALSTHGVGKALRLVGCKDRRGHEEFEAWIDSEDYPAAIVLPGPTDHPAAKVAIEVALPAGVPVVLWPRSPCTGCDGGECRVGVLAERLRAVLADTDGDAMPEAIRKWRAKDYADDSGDLVLLWDDPGRQPPEHLMMWPGEEGQA